MDFLAFQNGSYKTPARRVPLFSRAFPSLVFYLKDVAIVARSAGDAKRGKYGSLEWGLSSLAVLRALESVGVKIEITGADNFRGLEGPCVFISNHMSTLETFALPSIIVFFKDVTFVVKNSLLTYPVFGHVMRSRDPVTVGRANPREDLKAVMEGGTERLRAGRSMIIFPQASRDMVFDPSKFNTIGVKLAKRAEVPVIPIAVRSDAWGNGRLLKDYGKIDPSKLVRFAFGEPIKIAGRGDEEHAEIIEFISGRLKEWGGVEKNGKIMFKS